jgi:hypothetical protein
MTELPPGYRMIDWFPDPVRRVRSHMPVPVAALILLLIPFPLQVALPTASPDCSQQVAAWRKDFRQKLASLPSSPEYKFKPTPQKVPASTSPLRLVAVKGSETLEARFSYRAKTMRTQVLAFATGTVLPTPDDQFRAQVESSLQRSDNEPGFPESQIAMAVATDPNDGYVKINVCLDPQQPIYVQPGRYEGRIVVSAAGVEQEAIPITVMIQDPRWFLAVLWAVFGVILGLAVKMLSDLQNTSTSGTTSVPQSLWGQVVDYSKKPRFVVSVLLGMI